jgi:HD-GYP domain-containing protein (c-di-GMP phosphodiesterase class II)
MIGARNGFDDSDTGLNEAGSRVHWAEAVARNLSAEFGAPVGIFDSRGRRWCALVGATESQLPTIGESFVRRTHASDLGASQVALWRTPGDREHVWLMIPLPGEGATPEVAILGFQSPAVAGKITPAWDEDTRDYAVDAVGWGPSCPDAALRAWGQQAADRLRNQRPSRKDVLSTPPSNVGESRGVVISRLTRRMRISDPPHHFQNVATTVLRTSLDVQAVAWVPKDANEPVVVSGSIEGLSSHAYRTLPSSNGRDSTVIDRGAEMGRHGGAPPAVRRYVSVAAGSVGWLLAVNPRDERGITAADIEPLQYVGSLIVAQLSNARIYADLKELLFGIIRALTAAIDAKDPYTSGHSERVARIAVRLAEELGMPSPKRSDLYLAGLLHDVGKIGIDDGVLKKTGPLTPEEYRKIQAHVEIGVTILKDLKKLHHILPGVRHHHESLDGKGYPDRLAGDQIPLEARILAVADSFDAMSSNRPYRKRLSLTQIDTILQQGRSVQWDPAVIDALFACRNDLEAIRQKGLGESLIGAVDVTLGRN